MTEYVLLLGINAISLLLMFLYFRLRIRRTLALEEITEKLKKEVGSLVLELNATADRNIALLEDRIKALQHAASMADKRIALLNKELEKKDAQAGVYTNLGRIRRSPVDEREGPPESPRGEAFTSDVFPSGPLTAEAIDLKRILSEKTDAQGTKEEIPKQPIIVSRAETQISYEPSFREKVLDLSRKGFSKELIAAKLGSALGEVDLALSLAEHREGLEN